MKALVKYLAKKPDLSELDMMKIWKGLYYSYWMSDKPKVQEELAMQVGRAVQLCFALSSLYYTHACWAHTIRKLQGPVSLMPPPLPSLSFVDEK